MLTLSYLSEADRKRLTEINQKLLTDLVSPEEAIGLLTAEKDELRRERHAELQKEAAEIQNRTKTLQQCTVEDLNDFRRQLFELYQKHSAIGSKQVASVAQSIKLIEHRLALINSKQVAEPEKTPDEPKKPKSKSRVSGKQSSYSWSIDVD